MIYISVLFDALWHCYLMLQEGFFSRGLFTQIVRNNSALLSLVVLHDVGSGKRLIGP